VYRISVKPPHPCNLALILFLCLYLYIPPVQVAQAAELSYSMPGSPGPLTVYCNDVTLHDGSRGKDIELRATYPKEPGSYPVVIFSHGAGGSSSAATPLVRYWASHGYIIIAPTHADSIELYKRQHPEEVEQWRKDGGRLFMAKMLRDIGRSPEDWANRAQDISFVLDELETVEMLIPGLTGKPDYTRIGMSGHSYGAFTTMLIGGAEISPPGAGYSVNYADQRADALMVLSGQGVGRLGLDENSWEAFDRPMLVMSGTEDSSAGGMDIESRRDPYDYAPADDKYLVWIEDAYHASFTGGLAEGGETAHRKALWVEWVLGSAEAEAIEQTDQVAVFDCVKSATLAFWDSYLKDDESAVDWLTAAHLRQASGAELEFSSK